MARTAPARVRRDALAMELRAQGQGWARIARQFTEAEGAGRLVAMRWAHGWSQWDVANRWNALWPPKGGTAGINDKHISGWENWAPGSPYEYTVEPSLQTLRRLAQIYECDVADLASDVSYSHLDQARQAAGPGEEQQPEGTGPGGGEGVSVPGTPPPGTVAVEVRRDWVRVPAPVPGGFAYRERADARSGPDESWMLQEVLMTAAHEGGERAENAGRREIGDATLEQFRAEVTRFSHEFMTAEPFPLFLEMRRVRSRVYAALERRLWPGDQNDLYYVLAALSCLMAESAAHLGNTPAAEELAHAGLAYATAIGHQPLIARLYERLTNIAYWDGRHRQARDLARRGVEYMAAGPNAALLHLQSGRAAAMLGEAEAARRAIADADEARERPHSDDLLAVGGEFGFSRATQSYFAGTTAATIPGAETEAITRLTRAAGQYAAGPEPGEDHSEHCRMAAHIDLATVRLRSGDLDAAAEAAVLPLALPAGMRTGQLVQRLALTRAELAAPRYQGSPEASAFDEQIEAFLTETIAGDLRTLPSASG